MKEYKIFRLKKFFPNDADLEETLNQFGREGWRVVTATFTQGGRFFKFLLERDKNRMN